MLLNIKIPFITWNWQFDYSQRKISFKQLIPFALFLRKSFKIQNSLRLNLFNPHRLWLIDTCQTIDVLFHLKSKENAFNCWYFNCFAAMQGQDNLSSSGDHRLALIHEMSAHNFDLIRFASYRTATKLRFIQKKVSCKFNIISLKDKLNKAGFVF